MNTTAIATHPAPVSLLRLAVVTETYPPEINGVALTIERMVNYLLTRGHTVQLVRPRQAVETGTAPPGLELVTRPGLPVPLYRHLRFGLPSVRALTQLWTAQRPALVHIVTEGPLGRSALTVAERLGIPVLSGFHTNFHSYSRHYGLGFLHNTIVGYLRRFHNRCAVTLVPTDELRQELTALGFGNAQVVSRGVETALFNPSRRSAALRQSWGADEDTLVVGYVGRIAHEKNLPLAIEAFLALQTRVPKARFVLVGDGPLLPELRSRYPQFIYCGLQRGEALAMHYASLDLFPLPSTTETFGNVVLEAMASSLAVVSFDYAAGRQHIVPGQSGVLVPLPDRAAFIDATVALAADPERVRAMGQAARVAVARCDWEQILGALEAIFRQVVTDEG